MKTEQFRDALSQLNLPTAEVARRLGINYRSMRRMKAGTENVPPVVLLALETLLKQQQETTT